MELPPFLPPRHRIASFRREVRKVDEWEFGKPPDGSGLLNFLDGTSVLSGLDAGA
jgi:hypothetical protein